MTEAQTWVLGVDGGNTKTLALLCDPSGAVRGWGRAGPCNIYVSEEGSLGAVKSAVEQAFAAAGMAPSPVAALTLSAAGADWPEDFGVMQDFLESSGWARKNLVVNDAVGALRAGSLAGLGVTVVCGTSAGTAARAPDGQLWHSSYWQEPEGAEELGKLALRAVYRAALGVGPQTTLTAILPPLYGCADAEALLHLHTGRQGPSGPSVAHLARYLLDAAEDGDPVSRDLVQKHGAALGDYALAVARKVGLSSNYLLVTSGGVMRHPSPLLRESLLARVQAEHPGVRGQASDHEPVFGAALLALEAAGHVIDDAVWQRLSETAPEETWVHT